MLFFWCCELLVRSRLDVVSTSSKLCMSGAKQGEATSRQTKSMDTAASLCAPASDRLQFSNAHSLPQVRADLAASFQVVAVKHLEHRCRRGVSWALETCPDIK